MTGEPRNNKKSSLPMVLLGIIVLVAIIVVNIIVWRNYFDQQDQVEALKAQVQQVNQQASQASQPPSGLESELEKAKDDLAQALQVFPPNINRNDVVDFIINTAKECKVEIVPLVADGEVAGNAAQPSNVMRYHGTVSGSLSQASDFLNRLQNGSYHTMIITGCKVQRVMIIDNAVSQEDIKVNVDFDIDLYISSAKGG